MSAVEAIGLVHKGDTVVFGGFVGLGFPEEIGIELERQFLEIGRPGELTLLFAAGQGDGGNRGLNHLAHQGLIRRMIGGHIGLVPKLQDLALSGKIEAYNLPLGILSHLFRDIAAGKPGTLSRVGLGTFVDPRQEGGKLNDRTVDDIVDIVEIDGREYLFYRAMPIDVAFLRGTTADTAGNITMEKEALTTEALSIAMAAHNSGGRVVVQVDRICQSRTLNSREVKIPGILVDVVVKARPENHWQSFGQPFDPVFSGNIRMPINTLAPMDLDIRKIIARRGALELRPRDVVNLGIGIPEGVGSVANEEDILDFITLTAEPGVIGGMPVGGINFGAAINADAVIDQPYQFDFYDGGGLDLAFLGMAETDGYGNVNVSKFGGRFTGAGGFINISQNAKKVVFLGSFSVGGLKVEIRDGEVKILSEGRLCKFVRSVEQITFSGKYAADTGRKILYVTERCVFSLSAQGLILEEIAPGIHLEKNILDKMGFSPLMPRPPRIMAPSIFSPEPMNLKSLILGTGVHHPLVPDPEFSAPVQHHLAG